MLSSGSCHLGRVYINSQYCTMFNCYTVQLEVMCHKLSMVFLELMRCNQGESRVKAAAT